MSVAEIIREIPNLSEADRRAIREVLLQIANQDPYIALCNQTALDGALMLDRLEDEDARRSLDDGFRDDGQSQACSGANRRARD